MAKRSPRGEKRTEKRQKVRDVFVPRPFAGLADEAEWVALRELVPAASAPLTLAPDVVAEAGERTVVLATVLPMAWPAMHRADGTIFIGLQRQVNSGDVSRDLAAALISALQTPAGQTVAVPALAGPGPRLQDVLVADAPLDVTLHEGFEFWLTPDAADDSQRQGVAGAGERVDLPDGAAGGGARGVLVPGDRQGARALGAARRRGPGAGRAGPARGRRRDQAGGRDPVRRDVPGPRPAGARMGPAGGRRRRSTGRRRWPSSPSGTREALAVGGALTAGRAPLPVRACLGRQLTLR